MTVSDGSEQPSWKTISEANIASINSKIPKEWLLPEWPTPQAPPFNVIDAIESSGILTKKEIELTTKYSATQLADKIKNRELTSYELTLAICKRSAVAHQYLNCFSGVFFEEALERAKELDNILAITGKTVGPLHGIPLSVKDHMFVKGMPSPTAYVQWLDREDVMNPDDGIEVKAFRDAGCVFYCKTTNPLGLMVLETVSNLNGRTLNPFNTKLTSGGSSGGECSLIGAGGSLLGITTDIGGSIRVPAAYQGLYAIKPSAERWLLTGCAGNHAGNEAIKCSIGPVARSWDDVNLFMKAFFASEPWKKVPSIPPMPWNEEIFSKPTPKLRIAVWANDGFVTPHPPLLRAIKETADKLRAAGHDVIEWTVPEDLHHKHVAWDDVLLPLYWTDGGKDLKSAFELSGEPLFPSIKKMLEEPMHEQTIHELWANQLKKQQYRAKYLKLFVDREVDAILTPVGAACSYPHDYYPWWGYGAQWNLLDYPGAILPVSTVDKSIDVKPEHFRAQSEKDQETFDIYDPELYDGMPISLQVIGKPYEEEKVLLITREIDQLVNGK